MKKERNIKTSAFTLKFANTGKRELIREFVDEYQITINKFIEYFWNNPLDRKLITSEFYNMVESRLSAEARQICAAQANNIVKGTKTKLNQQIYRFNKLIAEQKFESAAKLLKKIEKNKISMPLVDNVKPELTSNLVGIAFNNTTSFGGWLNLYALRLDGAKGKFCVPLKKHKHFNQLISRGEIIKSVLLSKNSVDLRVELPEIIKKSEGTTVGLDIGYTDVFRTSDGQGPLTDLHGWTLPLIIEKINRRKKGSKGYLKAQDHRKNYINQCLNNLNLDNIKVLRLEKIKDLRKGQRTSAALRHWTYADISKKLNDLCKQQGVLAEYISPAFTSQRCSVCGWVKKTNRNGKLFKCKSCGHAQNADLNAAVNISLDLEHLPNRKELDNKTGFYWKVYQEPIVPDTRKENNSQL